LRYYHFTADEILDEGQPNFNPFIDPKCNWALNHPEFFPIDVNRAGYAELLRVPGIGVVGARRIVAARRSASLDFAALQKLGVTIKRARYFILCRDGTKSSPPHCPDAFLSSVMSPKEREIYRRQECFGQTQLDLFAPEEAAGVERLECPAGRP
jgi:predicted DNA-binding helix-hairpin-helix protein